MFDDANMDSMLYINGESVSDTEDIIDSVPDNVELSACPICARTFTPSALDKHVGICEKSYVQKRTPFDSFRQRREGTGLETYLPSNYGLIAKPKTSKMSPTDSKSICRSISSMCDSTIKRRPDELKVKSKETPLMNRSMTKRSLGPINEVCPHCGRSFGSRAYDRHIEWCREKTKITQPTMSAQQHLAKERMQARTKYKAPTLRSKRNQNREKYSSLSESMNNLSDSGGVSIMDFNSVADPYDRGRKSSIMSLSMTSSIASDGGFSDKYDPFISAKRQFEDLFSAGGIATNKEARTPTSKMSTSLFVKSPSSPIKTQPKSNFRRSSSLRVSNTKKTSPISFMPKYKPSIQRGISDEGPISSNFMKPEEYDELPVKSHAIIPPDLVPKSPKPASRDPLATSPVVVKRQPSNIVNRRHLHTDIKNNSDFPLTKTDSLAAFLKFENDLEYSTDKDDSMTKKEMKDKSNTLNKSLSELIDNKMSHSSDGVRDALPDIDTILKNSPIRLAPIDKPSVNRKIMLKPISANSESNNNHIRIDDQDSSIDSNLINSCDNLRISNLSKLPNESSSFEESKAFLNETDNATTGIDLKTTADYDDSTRDPFNMEDESHQNMERIVNLKNIHDTDKRNPKRQMQLHKDSLLFENAMTFADADSDYPVKDTENQFGDIENHLNSSRSQKTSAKSEQPENRQISTKELESIETLFDDFDLEEFISSFSDNEQFPIFKNYKDMVSGQLTARKPHGSESTSEESEFDDKIDVSDVDVSEQDRTFSASSSVERDKSENNRCAFQERPFKQPDVTVDAEKKMKLESELNKFGRSEYKTDTKLSQLQEILGESGEMSQAERELLTSVQELNSMCDDSKDLNLNLPIGSPPEVNNSFKSLFLHSPSNKANSGSLRLSQRSRPHLSYHMPEIVGVPSNNNFKDSGRIKASPLEQVASRPDSAKLNNIGNKANPLNGFDRVLPPIVVHKNDSQNIYNTINTSSSCYDQSTKRSDAKRTDTMTSSAVGRKMVSAIPRRDKDTPNTSHSASKLSKFCYECGARFIMDEAKFCMDCGVKRATLT